MIIQYNQNITAFNTLHLQSKAKFYIELSSLQFLPYIKQHIQETRCNYLILGGGSNLILPETYNGFIIHNKLSGINLINEDDNHVYIEAMAGQNWDNFVLNTINNGWYGLENLSLIPGTVGASPIQNIGAYGVEVKDFIESVKVYDLLTGETYSIMNQECNFSYRNSIFKKSPHLLVISVVFKLLKCAKLNITYKDVAKCLDGIISISALDVRSCVISIRQDKLPNPDKIGNVGSFFHNPIITKVDGETLTKKYPTLPIYFVDEKHVKVSAGWLIDNLGLKGYALGNVAVYNKQALVLINLGQATQTELLNFAKIIQDKVSESYGIWLNIEPKVINT